MDLVNTRAMQLLQQGLGASALRHRAISHNLANLNTPGYKALRVDFMSQFRGALAGGNGIGMAATSPGHMVPGSAVPAGASVSRSTATSMRTDGNNVDIDAEMVRLAENQIYYQAMANQISARFGMMSTVISEGGR